jgi:hypothetical protein
LSFTGREVVKEMALSKKEFEKCHAELGYWDGKALTIDMLKYVLGMCWVFVTQLKAYIVYVGWGF